MNHRHHLLSAFFASMLLVAACSSDNTGGDTGTMNTYGGSAGQTSSAGGSAGSSAGGNAGSSAGGNAGSSAGGSAGSGTGGTAGSTAGGSGGSTGGSGGGATGGSGGGATGGSGGGTTAMTTVEVGASGFSFSPSTVTIAKGDTVHFVWKSSGHNVVSGENGTADGKFCSPSDTGCDAAPLSPDGTTYDHTFQEAGTFPYFCSAHFSLGMTGTVVVQ